MKRRKFIKSAAAAGIVVPTMINGIPLQAHSTNQWLSTVLNPSVETDHVLVIIQMNGGNDGLNTVVPLDQLSKLNVARPNVVLKDANILKLNGTTKVGLHPSLTGFQTLYNEGNQDLNKIQRPRTQNQVEQIDIHYPDIKNQQTIKIDKKSSKRYERKEKTKHNELKKRNKITHGVTKLKMRKIEKK